MYSIFSTIASRRQFNFYITRSDSFRKIGEAMMFGAAGQQRVPEDFIKNYIFGYPSLYEQYAIVDFLDRKTAKFDALISKIHKAIEKLQEYRTALISAAVTGKIDLRNENRN